MLRADVSLPCHIYIGGKPHPSVMPAVLDLSLDNGLNVASVSGHISPPLACIKYMHQVYVSSGAYQQPAIHGHLWCYRGGTCIIHIVSITLLS